MRDDTLYSIGHDAKYLEERRAALAAQRTRAKTLEKPHVGWRERLGICVGCLGMLVLLVFALAVWFGFAK